MELINQKLGVDNWEKIATGQVIKALILNGLGMVSRPLYLFSQFFEDKAIEKLLGTGINSEYLNDDKIGRVMDDIYQLGLTNLGSPVYVVIKLWWSDRLIIMMNEIPNSTQIVF